MNELYGPEHFDSPYFSSLKEWLSTKKFNRGVEIGFAWGMSAMAYLETQTSSLISIDLDDMMGKEQTLAQIYPDRWRLIIGDSATELNKLTGKFDYIYIDGDHSTPTVTKDLEIAHKKLDKNGVIVCDDYGNPGGVKKAVDVFVKKYGYKMTSIPKNPNGGVVLCLNG